MEVIMNVYKKIIAITVLISNFGGLYSAAHQPGADALHGRSIRTDIGYSEGKTEEKPAGSEVGTGNRKRKVDHPEDEQKKLIKTAPQKGLLARLGSVPSAILSRIRSQPKPSTTVADTVVVKDNLMELLRKMPKPLVKNPNTLESYQNNSQILKSLTTALAQTPENTALLFNNNYENIIKLMYPPAEVVVDEKAEKAAHAPEAPVLKSTSDTVMQKLEYSIIFGVDAWLNDAIKELKKCPADDIFTLIAKAPSIKLDDTPEDYKPRHILQLANMCKNMYALKELVTLILQLKNGIDILIGLLMTSYDMLVMASHLNAQPEQIQYIYSLYDTHIKTNLTNPSKQILKWCITAFVNNDNKDMLRDFHNKKLIKHTSITEQELFYHNMFLIFISKINLPMIEFMKKEIDLDMKAYQQYTDEKGRTISLFAAAVAAVNKEAMKPWPKYTEKCLAAKECANLLTYFIINEFTYSAYSYNTDTQSYDIIVQPWQKPASKMPEKTYYDEECAISLGDHLLWNRDNYYPDIDGTPRFWALVATYLSANADIAAIISALR